MGNHAEHGPRPDGIVESKRPTGTNRLPVELGKSVPWAPLAANQVKHPKSAPEGKRGLRRTMIVANPLFLLTSEGIMIPNRCLSFSLRSLCGVA